MATELSKPTTMFKETWNEPTTWIFLQIMLGIYDSILEQEDSGFENQVWIYALDLFKEQLDQVASQSLIEGMTVENMKKKWQDLASRPMAEQVDSTFYNEICHVLKNDKNVIQQSQKLKPLQRERTVPDELVQERVIRPAKGYINNLDSVSYDQILEIHRQQNEWFLKQQDQFFQRFHTAMTGQSSGGRLTAFEEFQLKRKANKDEQVVDFKRARPFS